MVHTLRTQHDMPFFGPETALCTALGALRTRRAGSQEAQATSAPSQHTR